MKKVFCLLLAFFFVFSLISCSNDIESNTEGLISNIETEPVTESSVETILVTAEQLTTEIQTEPETEETTALPETIPPVTEPPVTEPPVTEPPVTEPPVTEPPVTEPPVTEPPVTEPPVVEPEPVGVMVPILMFHDVKTYAGGTWSMSADNFRSTMEFILDQGFVPISFRQLVGFVDGYVELPEKPVCITLDDGYYSNFEFVLPIITELNIPVTVFMTCDTVRAEDDIPGVEPNRLYKLSASDLTIMEASPLVDIQSHTYGLHGVNTSYSEVERDNSLPLEGESEEAYKAMFNSDCEIAEGILKDAGVWSDTVFSYPSGKHCEWSEEVLKERGYRVSLSTNYGHRNWVVQGDRESLFLLGRMNVNDDTTEESLLYYLERK